MQGEKKLDQKQCQTDQTKSRGLSCHSCQRNIHFQLETKKHSLGEKVFSGHLTVSNTTQETHAPKFQHYICIHKQDFYGYLLVLYDADLFA